MNKSWWNDSSGGLPALEAWVPEFKPQYNNNNKKALKT
jgi:hypothetical protein